LGGGMGKKVTDIKPGNLKTIKDRLRDLLDSTLSRKMMALNLLN